MGHQTDIAGRQRGFQTAGLGIVLLAQLAGKTVAGAAGSCIDGPRPCVPKRSARRAAMGSNRIGPKRKGVSRRGWISTVIAMDAEDLLGLVVIECHLVIGDRPGERDAALVLQRAEIPLAQAEHRSAIEFGRAADIVIHARIEGIAVTVQPAVASLVFLIEEYGLDVPVRILARNEIAAFQHQDPILKPVAQHLKERGKPHKLIIVAIARRLVTIANAILKTGISWQPKLGS